MFEERNTIIRYYRFTERTGLRSALVLGLLASAARAQVLESEHFSLQYDAAQPAQALRLVNKYTGSGLNLSGSAPLLQFEEGNVGGPDLRPVKIVQQKQPDDRRLVLDYAPQALAGARLNLQVVFVVPGGDQPLRKYAEYRVENSTGPSRITLRQVTLLDEPLPGPAVFTMDGWQSYPVFTDQFFFGVEFPAAKASATNNRIVLSHAPGLAIDLPRTYRTREAVIGSCPQGQVRETFEQYVDSFRPRADRIHFNYNSWWTSPLPYTRNDVLKLIETFQENLCRPHGVPFDSFTIDLGWSERFGLWKISPKLFPQGFTPLNAKLAEQKSRLGLWCSPSNCYTPDAFDTDWARRQGYESHLGKMCLARGGRYQQATREALSSLAREFNLGQMKFDGYMPSCDEKDHGHLPGELSRECMAEGMIEVLTAIRQAQPDLWMETTCFGFDASPWWLRYVDSVIGPFGDDSPFGAVPAPIYRESYTTSRDFYNLHGSVTPVPIAAQEVLGIIHQSADPLYNDAAVTVLRGHQFISLYLNPKYLKPADCAFLGQLMVWSRANAPLLARTKVIWPKQWREKGPVPYSEVAAMPRQTYGYAHWRDGQGLLCLRNPWIATDRVELVLDQAATGVGKDLSHHAACQVYPYPMCLAKGLKYGDSLSAHLGAYETKVIRLIEDNDAVQPQADPLDRQLRGVTVAEATSRVVEISYAPVDGERLGDRSTITSPAQALAWNSTIRAEVPDEGWQLYYLIESPKAIETAEAQIKVNGMAVPPRLLDSETGWSASQPVPQRNLWKWWVVPVPKGAWEAQASIEIEQAEATVSAWLMRAFDPPVATPREPSEPGALATGQVRVPAFPLPPDYRSQVSAPVIALTKLADLKPEKATRPPNIETIAGIYLDRMAPVSAEQGWGTLKRNQSVAEHLLRIGTRRFLRGLGTHAPAKLVYNLDGRYKTFHGFAGQDAAAGGTIAFEIWVDDTKKWESGLMTKADPAKEFQVPVVGAKSLTLKVTNGGDSHIGDHADWANVWLEE